MRTSQLWGGIAFAAAVLSGSAASAAPITLPAGPIYGKFAGVEQLNLTPVVGTGFTATSGTTGADCAGCVTAAGPENVFGVFVVSNLDFGDVGTAHQDISQTGPTFFANGGGGSTYGNQISGIFYGEQVVSSTGANTAANGGVLDLYWWDSNKLSQTSLDASIPLTSRTTQSQYSNVTCGAVVTNGASGCTFLARLDLVPGSAEAGGAVDPTKTAQANADLSGSSGGNSKFYLEVDTTVTGAWTNQLATQWFFKNFDGLALPDIADVSGQYDFTHCSPPTATTCAAWGNGVTSFGLNINDPFTFFAAPVPEPATLTLLGTALLGLGARRRRRNAK